MVHMYRETYEKNIIEAIEDNYGILCLNRIHAEEGLYHKNLREITTKYHSDHRKYRYELVNEPIKCNRVFINKKLAVKVIRDCRTTSAHKFRTKMDLNNVILF